MLYFSCFLSYLYSKVAFSICYRKVGIDINALMCFYGEVKEVSWGNTFLNERKMSDLLETQRLLYDILFIVCFFKWKHYITRLFLSLSLSLSLDCGATFTSSTGSFFSPNYPAYYPKNRDCIFKIIVEVNMQIMLNFTDFQLEGSPPSCNYDFVEIR